MTMTPTTSQHLLLLLLVLVGSSKCVKIQFFDEQDFQGLFYEMDSDSSTTTCKDLPDYGDKILSSIKTNGECVILYEGSSCIGGSSGDYSVRIGPENEYHHSDLSTLEFNNRTSAFRICNEEEGGTKIHVKLFPQPNLKGTAVFEHSDLCGCVNLPQSYVNASSVNNHGNCVKLYKEENCQGEMLILGGGKSQHSQDLSLANFNGLSKSMGLCSAGLRQSCLKMNADVFKFEVQFPQEASPHHIASVGDAPVATQDVALASPTVFSNKASSSSVVHEYSVEETIQESVKIGRIPGLMSLDNVNVDEGLYVESGVSSIGLFGRAKITPILQSAYQFLQQNSTEHFSHEEEQKVVVNQRIDVAPCTQYQITSSVKVVHDHPMDYDVHVKLTGQYGGEQMPVQELKENLPEGFEFVEDLDEFSFVAKAGGKMTATFAHQIVVDGEESEIEGCTRSEIQGHHSASGVVKENIWIENNKMEIYVILALSLITTFGVAFIIIQMVAENRMRLIQQQYHAREPSIRSLPPYWQATNDTVPIVT